MNIVKLLLPIICITSFSTADLQSNPLKFSGLYYIAYENEVVQSPSINKFRINRAYITIEKEIFDFLDSRLTYDVYDDDDGAESRLKYLYARFKLSNLLNNSNIIDNLNIKFGMIHTLWVDFEDKINSNRMQGTMFIERIGLTPSSDFGASINGFIGGLIDDEYRKNVSNNNPGRYGSFDFGIFNGAGYNRFELNDNKALQGRLTLRPLPSFIPGLQFSILGISGKGNYVTEDRHSPIWQLTVLMLSFEHQYFTLIGQISKGQGDFQGKILNSDNEAIKHNGLSVFGEIKYNKFKLISRFDYFMPDEMLEKFRGNRMILAIGYDFGNKNILLLDYDHLWKYNSQTKLIKLTMQLRYN